MKQKCPAPKPQAVVKAIVFCVLAAGLSIFGQFPPREITERESWEEFLVTADIVKAEPIGEDITASRSSSGRPLSWTKSRR